MLGEEQIIIDKHLLAKVFKINHTWEIEANQVEMLDAKVELVDTANRIPNIYNSNEGWVVNKMRSKYANRIAAILSIIYQKNKV